MSIIIFKIRVQKVAKFGLEGRGGVTPGTGLAQEVLTSAVGDCRGRF
ncbi:hypothetical protein F3157_00160 [Virgibacillus dakarensis]|nr:hypothetical protein [Virgibacillus dakarensis]